MLALGFSALLLGVNFLSGCSVPSILPPSTPTPPPVVVVPTALPPPGATAVPAPTNPPTAAPQVAPPTNLPQPTPAPPPPAVVATPVPVTPAPAPAQPGALPLRPASEAVQSYSRTVAGSRATLPESDLEDLLDTPLSESKIGFVNGHHFLASENKAVTHFSYALNPLYNEAADGRQRFLVFGNSPNFLNYRSGNLGEMLLANSDRAVWAANNGYRAVTVIQLDNDLSDELLRYIVASRAAAGFRSFVVGNEINDPGAPWRYNFPRLLRSAQVVKQTLESMRIRDAVVYTPSLAYFESDTYLDNVLDYAEANFKQIPSDGISTNFYGAVDDVRRYVDSVYNVLRQHRLGNLKLRIGEMGNPTGSFQQTFADEQIAYNYLPQAMALALSTEHVDSLDIYSLFSFGENQYSLTYLDGSKLQAKPSLEAAIVAARALARIKDIDYKEEGDVRRVIVERDDGVRLWLVWSVADSGETRIKRPNRAEVFGALGNRLDEDEIVLTPRPHSALAGTVKYVVLSH